VAIQGSLEEASLPDVLQLLSLGKKTGCISLTERSMEGSIYLDKGRVSHAAVVNRRDRLGDILVKSGRITQEQLTEAVAAQTREKRISQILVESGQIDRAEIDKFVRAQVEEAVYFLFTWRTGTFTFQSKVKPENIDFLVSIDPEGMLLEGARRVDEWSLIEKKIPSLDMVFRLEKTPLLSKDVTLSEAQKRVLPSLDGKRDVNALVDETGLVEFEVGKALYGLITAGFVKLVERRTRVRHLDYRELLAYLVHEAEFADAGRRREAARHIVDCGSCAQRLKKIHVRRTQGQPIPAEEESETDAAAGAAALADEANGGTDDAEELERRRLADRRAVERRRGERRRPVGTRPAGQVERRMASRRQADQRCGPDRRMAYAYADGRVRSSGGAAAVAGGGAAAAAPSPAAAPRRGRRRNTGPRDVPTQTRARPPVRESTRPRVEPAPPVKEVAAAAKKDEAPLRITQEIAGDFDITVEIPSPQSAPAAPAETPAAAAANPSDATREVPALESAAPPDGVAQQKTKEIEWLITPRESVEMLRSTRLSAQTSAPKEVRTPDTPARKATKSPARAVAKAAPAEAATVETRRVASPKPETHVAAAPKPAPVVPGPEGRIRRSGLRWVAAAAGIAMVAGAGYLLGTLGARGGTDGSASGDAGTSQEMAAETRAPSAATLGASVTGDAPTAAAPTNEPVQPPAAAPAPTQDAPPPSGNQPAVPAAAAARPAAAPQTGPPARPSPPRAIILTGRVLEDGSNRPLAGVTVTLGGTGRTATSGPDGTFRFTNPPVGDIELAASLAGYDERRARGWVSPDSAASIDIRLAAQPPAAAEPVAAPAPAAVPPPQPPAQPPARTEPVPAPAPSAPARVETDPDIISGDWIRIVGSEAEAELGRPIVAVEGLEIESIAKPGGPGRTGVRVVQLLESGERIEVVISRPAFLSRGGARRPGDDRISAVRVADGADGGATGTARLGSYLITVKAPIAGDALKSFMNRLKEHTP